MSAQKKFFTFITVLIFVIAFVVIATRGANAYFVISGDDVLAGATASGGLGAGTISTQASTTSGLPQAGSLAPTFILAVSGFVLTGLGGLRLIFSSKH